MIPASNFKGVFTVPGTQAYYIVVKPRGIYSVVGDFQILFEHLYETRSFEDRAIFTDKKRAFLFYIGSKILPEIKSFYDYMWVNRSEREDFFISLFKGEGCLYFYLHPNSDISSHYKFSINHLSGIYTVQQFLEKFGKFLK